MPVLRRATSAALRLERLGRPFARTYCVESASSSPLVSSLGPKRISMYDTTLRDGTQGEGVSLSLKDKLLIAEKLDDVGFDFIEGGFPSSNEKDVAFFEQVKRLNLRSATVCAFGMTRRKGIEACDDPGMLALVRSEAPVCTVVGKTWDFHVEAVLRVSLHENLAMIRDSVGFLASEGRRVVYDAEHFFDGWKANPEHARATIVAAAEAGAEAIALCDTNGGSTPLEIDEYVREALDAVGHLGVAVGVHCHNDCDLAVANSLAAVRAGATQVQGTINGIGERCGNADLISVSANLALKSKGAYSVLGAGRRILHSDGTVAVDGESEALSITRLTELSRYVDDVANLTSRAGQPFVGRSAFAHKGGMHAHAMQLAPSSYEHIDPALTGNTRRILVSELSGRSNITALTEKFGITDPDVTKNILAAVVRNEAQGYTYEAAEASFSLVVRKAMDSFTPHFKRIRYQVEVSGYGGSRGDYAKHATDASYMEYERATAQVKVALPNGKTIHEVDEGNGPVAALDKSLRKALEPVYPQLADLQLTDYKVRVVKLPEMTPLATDAEGAAAVATSPGGGRMGANGGLDGQVMSAAAAGPAMASEATNGLHTLTGTASAIRVIVESFDRGSSEVYSTVGVGTNIIEASWRALVDAVEYKLWKDDERWAKQGQFEATRLAKRAAQTLEANAATTQTPQITVMQSATGAETAAH